MSKIKIELDMDGVFTDFLAYYIELGDRINLPVKKPYTDYSINPELFIVATTQHSIFEKIPLRDGALELKSLIEEVEEQYNVEVAMLTSCNTKDPALFELIRSQKQAWLNMHGFKWNMQCVTESAEKGDYATPSSLLIDDSSKCITSFLERGGNAILYTEFNTDVADKVKEFVSKCYENTLVAV